MCHIIRRIVKWENRSRDSFSNELFDAFPVEVIEKRNGILYEVRVTYTEEGNLQKYVYLHKRIGRYLLKYNIHLAEYQRFEVPIAMEEYIKEIAKWFQRGVCITVDYGYTKKNGCIPHIKKVVYEDITSIN